LKSKVILFEVFDNVDGKAFPTFFQPESVFVGRVAAAEKVTGITVFVHVIIMTVPFEKIVHGIKSVAVPFTVIDGVEEIATGILVVKDRKTKTK
jgi:hypothetical protein